MPRLALDYKLPPSTPPSSWDYRHELPCLTHILSFKIKAHVADVKCYLLFAFYITKNIGHFCIYQPFKIVYSHLLPIFKCFFFVCY
jgi:hypothetical protein